MAADCDAAMQKSGAEWSEEDSQNVQLFVEKLSRHVIEEYVENFCVRM